MADDTIPVDRRMGLQVLDKVLAALPDGWRLMPIGALGMMRILDAGQKTKDVDLVAVVVEDGAFRVPPTGELEAFARQLSSSVTVRKDETSILLLLELEGGHVKVELVRGRNPRSGGFFVTRRVLENCAALAGRRGNLLEISAEGLAFLKAWAATDKDKLVEAGRDTRGYHKARADAFRQDVQRIADAIRDQGVMAAGDKLRGLLNQCPPDRRKRVEGVLRAGGWTL